MAKGSVNGSCSVSSSSNESYTLTCSGSFTFGPYYQYGVRVRCYINGSQVATNTGYTTSKYQTCASCSGSKTITRTHSAQTISWQVTSSSETVSGYGGIGESDSTSGSITVPAKPSYTVSYSANGGSGAPSSQTKWYGETLTLSSTTPTRDGYIFVGWATSSSATSVSYPASGSYTGNAALTLYAVWEDDTAVCTIQYDVNGGNETPASQTHVSKTTSRLTELKPTKEGYEFLGWSTKSYASKATYLAGSRYYNDDFTDGDVITLYAVWRRVRSLMYINLPDNTPVEAVYIKIPEGSSLDEVYYKIDDVFLKSSDGYTFKLSDGSNLVVKDG